jgi:hypothetical protein
MNVRYSNHKPDESTPHPSTLFPQKKNGSEFPRIVKHFQLLPEIFRHFYISEKSTSEV